MWSGCMCVTMTRSTGRPSSCVAKMLSHCAFDSSLLMQQSTTVQPCMFVPGRAGSSISSRSSHRLMWSSANGRAMRIHLIPGAISMVVPGAGRVSPKG